MLTLDLPGLLHIVGYLTGATLYTMLLAMALRTAGRRDRLTLATAVLGVAWNVGEMTAHSFDLLGLPLARAWMSAASYAALGLLAAVVVHSVSRVQLPGDTNSGESGSRVLAWIAYGCAGVAGALQLVAAARQSTLPSPPALMLLTSGFLLLIPPLALATRRQPNSRRALWVIALAVFAVSALHLASFHGANEPLATELVGHHASIPLAFAILYQGYRFALADLFLKRAFTLLVLVSFIFGAWSTLAPSFVTGSPTPSAIGVLLTLWAVTALLFPWLQRGVTAFVDHVLLMRANYQAFGETFESILEECQSEDTVLERTCDALRPALSATSVVWEPRDLVPSVTGLTPREVPVLTADAPQYMLVVGTLAGGRRLLSDDLTMLERVAFLMARRIDVLRLTDERYERMLLEREMRTLATEAELKALRAQVNPHFLFNALTTTGYLIQSAPGRALDTLLRLTTLLRGVLKSEGEFTTLAHERELIECYLQIERERFEERLVISIDIPDNLSDISIPALIVQPLVENAIKHGIAKVRRGGLVSVSARLLSGDYANLVITVRNTGARMEHPRVTQDGGVGLRNVERRLACYYGDGATLTLKSDAEGATVAELRIPAADVEDRNVAVVSRRKGA